MTIRGEGGEEWRYSGTEDVLRPDGEGEINQQICKQRACVRLSGDIENIPRLLIPETIAI